MSAMTVGGLHKLLGSLIEQGHARKPVCIQKDTFEHVLEADGCVILDVEKAALEWVPQVDDDGGSKINRDGTEAGKTCFVLFGDDPRRLREGHVCGLDNFNPATERCHVCETRRTEERKRNG